MVDDFTFINQNKEINISVQRERERERESESSLYTHLKTILIKML